MQFYFFKFDVIKANKKVSLSLKFLNLWRENIGNAARWTIKVSRCFIIGNKRYSIYSTNSLIREGNTMSYQCACFPDKSIFLSLDCNNVFIIF
jgi:hypothetical protein